MHIFDVSFYFQHCLMNICYRVIQLHELFNLGFFHKFTSVRITSKKTTIPRDIVNIFIFNFLYLDEVQQL